MKYLLDFDHTLLDTDAFVAQVETDGNLERLISPEIWQLYDVHKFLYEDVSGWLGSKKIEDVHILTAWTPSLGSQSEAFQKEKLYSGKFDELVSSITFVVGEKGKAAAEIASQFPPEEKVVFVDDRIDQCLFVKASLPHALCCLMVRNPNMNSDVSNIEGIQVVHQLTDVDAIIESL